MSNLRNTNDMKKLVLQFAGELTDGTSPYDTVSLSYINSLYQSVLAGGNEFDIELAEPWAWAKARNPIVLTLKAPYETGTVTMTNGSKSFTFSSAPTDVNNWLLKVETVSDYYYIRYQSGTAGTLDQDFLGASGTYNFKAIKLDYELVDDTIVITDHNKYLDFDEGGSQLTATISKGVYSGSSLASEIQTKMRAAGTYLYVVSYSSVSRLFSFNSPSAANLRNGNGTNAAYSVAPTIGMSLVNVSLPAATTVNAENPLNAIQRLIAPATMYRQNGLSIRAPEDDGKIYGISYESFLVKFPLIQITQGVPDRFCELEERANGTKIVRFNFYPSEDMRVEFDYIPFDVDLQDNVYSVPKVPRSFREGLVYGATFKLMNDKSDNRAETYGALTKAKLQALVNHNRSGVEQTSKNYGKLIPRPYTYRKLRTDP